MEMIECGGKTYYVDVRRIEALVCGPNPNETVIYLKSRNYFTLHPITTTEVVKQLADQLKPA